MGAQEAIAYGMACRINCGYTWTADDPGWHAQRLIVEEAGLTDEVGLWVLNAACREARRFVSVSSFSIPWAPFFLFPQRPCGAPRLSG